VCFTRLKVRMTSSGQADTATQLAHERQQNTGPFNISAQTVRRVLKNGGMKSAGKVKKPRLLSRHIKARREFANRYKDWTSRGLEASCMVRRDQDWPSGIGRTKMGVEKARHRSHQPACVWNSQIRRRKSDDLGMHLVRRRRFCMQDLRRDGCRALYDHSQRIFLGTLEYYGLDRDEVVFQQDNDPKHTSRLASKWFSDNEIEVLQWPPQSPDRRPYRAFMVSPAKNNLPHMIPTQKAWTNCGSV